MHTQGVAGAVRVAKGSGQGRYFYAGLLEALVRGMGTAKGYLFDHAPRVAVVSHQLAVELDLTPRERGELFLAAVLSDLGMIGLVEDAWENPVPILPPDQRSEVMEHPQRSAQAVTLIPYLDDVVPILRHHHEWWDGSGYPAGLRGEEIPVGARILRLADTVTALGEERPQRPPLSREEIRREVEQGIGTEFNPHVASVYLGLLDRGRMIHQDGKLFQRIQLESVNSVLPADVSPLSATVLLEVLASLVDAKDPYTGGHSRRVAALSVEVAARLGLNERVQEQVRFAGYLHDLGKLAVPSRILRKPGSLENEERAQVRSHPGAGAELLEGIPSLRHLAAGCRHHHERWDGAGYPEGLSGERIPSVARILAVSDAYDAMTSRRAYRPALPHEQAMDKIQRQMGGQFGPREARALLRLPREVFQEVREVYEPGPDPLFPRSAHPRRLRLRAQAQLS